jgi:uncharacterized protein YjlB
MMKQPVKAFQFGDAGWCPNNPKLPLLFYHAVSDEEPGEDLARWLETTFKANGWPPAWRYTIYDFPHYHSTSHEVIGVFQGRARIRFGDSAGEIVEAGPGDVVVIPAGVSHERVSQTNGFCCVGGYPEGFERDLIRKVDASARPGADERIAKVPVPGTDPGAGLGGRSELPDMERGRPRPRAGGEVGWNGVESPCVGSG